MYQVGGWWSETYVDMQYRWRAMVLFRVLDGEFTIQESWTVEKKTCLYVSPCVRVCVSVCVCVGDTIINHGIAPMRSRQTQCSDNAVAPGERRFVYIQLMYHNIRTHLVVNRRKRLVAGSKVTQPSFLQSPSSRNLPMMFVATIYTYTSLVAVLFYVFMLVALRLSPTSRWSYTIVHMLWTAVLHFISHKVSSTPALHGSACGVQLLLKLTFLRPHLPRCVRHRLIVQPLLVWRGPIAGIACMAELDCFPKHCWQCTN